MAVLFGLFAAGALGLALSTDDELDDEFGEREEGSPVDGYPQTDLSASPHQATVTEGDPHSADPSAIFSGTALDDIVDGGGNDDEIFGNKGSDHLFGHAGDDVLFGGGRYESEDALGENDWLFGGGGNDTLYGGFGDDCLYDGHGSDSLIGGAGNDTLISSEILFRLLENNAALLSISEDSGSDTLMGGGGSDQFFVNAGDMVSTGSGRDAIFLLVRTLDDNFDGLSVDQSTSSEETLEQKTSSVQSRVDSLKPDVLIINDFDSTNDELIVVHDSMHGAPIELKCELIDGDQVLCLNGDAIARLAGPADFSIDRIRLVRLDELGVICHPITPPS